jgi:hypothetical protein
MGATFGAISGAIGALLAAAVAIFAPGTEDELGFMIMAFTAWGTLIGAGFATVLAIAARGRSFDELSLARTGFIGAGGGLLLASVLMGLTFPHWAPADRIIPFVVLPLLGASSATLALLIARRAGPALPPGDEPLSLGNGDVAPGRP